MKVKVSSKSRASLLIRALVTLAIFATIFWLLPMGDVWRAMTRIGWWRWALVLVAFAAGHLIAAYKWCRLIRAAGQPLAFRDAVRAHMAGLFANIWLPSIVGGDVVRAGWIAGNYGVVVPAAIGLLDRVLDLLALILLVACGALLMEAAVGELASTVLRYAGILLIAGLAIGLIALRWLRLDYLPARLRPYGVRLLELGKALYARPAATLGSFALALLVQFGFVGLNYFLATAMDIRVSFAVWLVAWPLAKIMALLPVSLGGLGVREAALAALLAPFAVTATLAIAQALVWQSVLLGFGVLAGMATLMGGQRPAIRGAS